MRERRTTERVVAVWCLISLLLVVLLADTAYVRVFISDVNDNKPVFAQRLYEVGVDEDADIGLAVVTVSANDEDEGMEEKRESSEAQEFPPVMALLH